MATMKAIKKVKPGHGGLEMMNVPIPTVKPDEVLIKVKSVGICGTDFHIYSWDEWSQRRIKPPVIIGHEFVGEIVEIGSNVGGKLAGKIYKGQRVSAEGHIVCDLCKFCRTGQGHICQETEIIGVDRDGCFAEYIAIPASNVWPVPDAIPDKYAAIFDPLGNAMNTVMAQPVAAKNVMITGAGAIGLFAIPIAKAMGAEQVIVMEPNPLKQELAKKVGADIILHPSDPDLVKKVKDATFGYGPDVLLEMSGHPGALKTGLELLSKGGDCSLLGIPGSEVSLNLAELIIFKGIHIHGITGRKMYETWYQCQSFLLKTGNLIDPIITHHIKFDQFQEGFDLMEKNLAAKVVMDIG